MNTDTLHGTASRDFLAYNNLESDHTSAVTISAGTPVTVTETRGGKYVVRANGARTMRMSFDHMTSIVNPS